MMIERQVDRVAKDVTARVGAHQGELARRTAFPYHSKAQAALLGAPV